MKCSEKVFFHTQAQAEEVRRALLEKNPKDKRNKFLRVYVCQRCGLYHVGHQKSKYAPKLLAAPKQPKQPTPGELRRAEKRAAAKAAKATMFADYTDNLRIAKILIDRELARYAALGVKPRQPQQP